MPARKLFPRTEKGFTLIAIAIVVGVIMAAAGVTMLFLGDAEVKDAARDQLEQDLDWSIRSAAKLVEDVWRNYLSNTNTDGELYKSIDIQTRELSLINAINSGNGLRILEYTQCKNDNELPATLPTSLPYRVDLDDSDGIVPQWTYNKDTNTITFSNTPIWNKIDPDSDRREFDALITVESDGVPHYSTNNAMYIFPVRFTVNMQIRMRRTNNHIATRTVRARGSVAFYIFRKSFSEYVMFSDQFQMADGTRIYFPKDFVYDGPVHTNTYFNFKDNPSTWFKDKVTQVGQTARFYYAFFGSIGYYKELDADCYIDPKNSNYNVIPTFDKGFNRGVGKIELPSTLGAIKDSILQKGTVYERPEPTTAGVDLPISDDGKSLKSGGVYIKGDVTSFTLSQGDRTQTYEIVMTIDSQIYYYTIISDYANNKTTFTVKIGNGSPTTTRYDGILDVAPGTKDPGNQAAFYINGKLGATGSSPKGLKGQIDRDTEVSVCATGNVVICNDLTYEAKDDSTAKNIMGILSESGSVYLDCEDKNSVDIHAAIMAPNGVFQAYDYSKFIADPRPFINLYGGIVQRYYGAVAEGDTNGYTRNFKHDHRLKTTPPPLYPKQDSYKYELTNDSGLSTIQWIWES